MSTQRVMVYVNEGDKKGRKVIESNAGRVLASYGHGLLVEADQAQLKALQKQGYSVEVQKEASMIKLRAVQFDTSVAVPATPAALTLTAAKRPTKQKRDYWLIQMVGPVKSEWGEQLMALGVKLGDYVPENAFLAHMTADAAENARALPFVNWVGLYEPAYKISPLLMGRKQRAMGNELATLAIKADIFKPAPEGNLTVLVHTPADRQKVVKAIEKAGGSIVASEGDTITASLDLAVADTIAKMMEVKWLEPHGRPVLHNNISAGIIGVQDVWDNHALDGDEQIVSVADTGLDTGVNDTTMHDDFEGRIINIYDRVGDGADDGGSDDDSGHGTHVAGSVLGNGSRSNGSVCGMAPAARLVFQAVKRASNDHLDGIPADYNTLFQQAYDDGARIHTNSWGATHDAWGNSLQGQYTTESQDIDEFMWNHKDSIILFSAANAGRDSNSNGVIDTDSLAVQACAKNCVTVGATEGNRPHGSTPAPGYDFDWATGSWAAYFPAAPINNDHVSDDPEGMAAFSSRGPTDDGRPKPDVVAPGTNILSVRSSAVTATPLWGDLPAADALHDLYCWSGGTSMSTPLTAGTVALIRQYLQRVCLHASPSGSLLKAVLIHGAVPITGQYTPAEVGAVPDNSQGWGRVNLQTSLFPDYPVRWEFRDNAADAVATGEQRNYTFPVVNTTVPFRATLAWTDFPSDPATGGGLVNQLRLSVIAPNGITTQGNPANNNVQQVVINNPQAGTYTVRVTGVNVPTLASEGQRQDFAVVISGGLNFVEVYIKDNPADTGIAPSAGTLCQSPDILVCLDNDPTATPAPNPEFGQTNYVFVRIHNRGPKAANNATVKLYWANPGTNLSKPFWHTDGIKLGGVAGNTQQVTVPARAAAGDSEVITSAFEWLPPDPSINTHDAGHFCLFASVTHPEDPLLQEDVSAVGWEDNLAWRNLVVKDVLPNTETSMEFYVAGEVGVSVKADLHIDRQHLPTGGAVRLKIPSRWLTGASLSNLQNVWQSDGGRVCKIEVTSSNTADIQNIQLQPGENTLVRLEVGLPEDAVSGELYTVYVDQKVNGQSRSRVTLLARTVGTPAYIANRRVTSLEIHLSNCDWAKKISPHNKVPYDDLQLALKRGFNGCRFCLPEYDTG